MKNTTTMNTGAASLSDEQILEHFEMPGLNLEATLDAHDIGLLLTGIRALLVTHAPQADAAPDLAEFGELIDTYQCAQKDGTHDERANARIALMDAYRAAIAAGGAQEEATDAESKLPEYKGCIEWSNYRNRQGYGSFKADGKMSLAHRVMYCDYHGVTLDSIRHLVVRHACDNPPCFNPAHLLLGTHADNTRDKMERGRHARGERNGQSKLSQHQVAQIRSLYVRGSKEFGIPALAKKYGVGQSTIRKVVLNLRWAHVAVSNGEQA
jgi:hypothetical protein